MCNAAVLNAHASCTSKALVRNARYVVPWLMLSGAVCMALCCTGCVRQPLLPCLQHSQGAAGHKHTIPSFTSSSRSSGSTSSCGSRWLGSCRCLCRQCTEGQQQGPCFLVSCLHSRSILSFSGDSRQRLVAWVAAEGCGAYGRGCKAEMLLPAIGRALAAAVSGGWGGGMLDCFADASD